MVSHQGGLSSGWSLLKVVSPQGGLSSRWSLLKVVSPQGSLSSGWSLLRVVSYQGDLSPGGYCASSLTKSCKKNLTNAKATFSCFYTSKGCFAPQSMDKTITLMFSTHKVLTQTSAETSRPGPGLVRTTPQRASLLHPVLAATHTHTNMHFTYHAQWPQTECPVLWCLALILRVKHIYKCMNRPLFTSALCTSCSAYPCRPTAGMMMHIRLVWSVLLASLVTSVCLGIAYLCLTCLLYTSPSPRDSGISRMPSSA